MWDEEKFFEEFKKTNDNIKPSQDFTKRLSEVVEAETTKKIIPFYRNKKKISIIAATAAALVLVVAGVGMYDSVDFGGDSGDYEVSHNDLDDDDSDDKDSDDFNTKINAGHDELIKGETSSNLHDKVESGTTMISADELIEEIEQGAKVVCDGEELNYSEKNRLVKKFESAELLDDDLAEELDEGLIARYKIYGDKTWIVEEYESGAIYISLK